jgi:hypothetical protein
LSGIGTYTITFVAEDMAGGKSQQKVTFQVNYGVAFTMVFTPPGCSPDRLGSSCQGKYQMTVNRANNADPDDASDGLMMFDQTVSADLVKASDGTVVASHSYGTGAIGSYVQIGTDVYKTTFDHPAGMPYTTFQLKVYFIDVDGSRLLQTTSSPLSF